MVFVDLVIAVQEISRGQVIPPNAVAVRPWPQQSLPFNGVSNLEDVVGRIARTDIFREQPILTNMVVDNLTGLARVGSDAAAVLPSGLVAVALPMDRLTSVAYAVQDGDRVDLIIRCCSWMLTKRSRVLSPTKLPFRITKTATLI
jgi:Flp pilus assembly protein CpaB